MCGRYCLYSSPKTISNDAGIDVNSNYKISYNISPGKSILTIFNEEDSKTKTYGYAQWGLKTPQNFHINSRIEIVDSAPRFKDAWLKRRLLLPANGFYEWYQDGLRKQPYYIFSKLHQIVYYAAIEYKISPDEKAVVILTTESNKEIRGIHSRMPLIIMNENHENWLDSSMSKNDATELSKNVELESHTISNRINKVINDDSSLIQKQNPLFDNQMSLF